MHNSTQNPNHIATDVTNAANSTIVKIRNNNMATGGAQVKVISVCIDMQRVKCSMSVGYTVTIGVIRLQCFAATARNQRPSVHLTSTVTEQSPNKSQIHRTLCLVNLYPLYSNQTEPTQLKNKH